MFGLGETNLVSHEGRFANRFYALVPDPVEAANEDVSNCHIGLIGPAAADWFSNWKH